MSNFSDPYILKHLEETLGTVHQGLCQARSALRSSASLSAVSGVDSSLYDCIDKALNLSAAAQQEGGEVTKLS